MISVCIATYNGEKYLRSQLDSIIKQLSDKDEIVISDDGSSDSTIDIITEYHMRFKNIVFLNGPRKGVVKNFENAFQHARGDYIFFSDQDDVWTDKKVETVMACFRQTGCDLVVHDAYIVDADCKIIEESFFEHRNSRKGFYQNIWKNSFLGCCMAVKKEVFRVALPFPDKIEMHDWWVGLITEKIGKTVFLKDKLLYYRRHGNNVSSFHHYPIPKMITNRLYLYTQVIKRLHRA